MNVHREIKRIANVLKTTYSRLKRLDSELLEMTNTSKKTTEQQTPPSLAKGTNVLKVKEQVDDVSDTTSKRKISPLQPEGKKKRKIRSRKEKPEQKSPCDLEMETDSPKADQEIRDPAWQQVETGKTKKKKENKKKEKEDGRSRLRIRRTRRYALIIKWSEGKSYADIIHEVKKEPTL